LAGARISLQVMAVLSAIVGLWYLAVAREWVKAGESDHVLWVGPSLLVIAATATIGALALRRARPR
jgi:hypothetical protein